MNPLFRIDFSISDSLKIVRKSVLIYETIIQHHQGYRQQLYGNANQKKELDERLVSLFIMVILVVQEEHCPRKLPIALHQRFLGILK